jgi:hypothetical protein
MASSSRARPPAGLVRLRRDTDAVLAWLRQHSADGVIATSNPALVHLRTGTPTIQLEGLFDRAVLKARGVRCVVRVHLAWMRVPADQGRSGMSRRGLDSGSSSCEHMRRQRTRQCRAPRVPEKSRIRRK